MKEYNKQTRPGFYGDDPLAMVRLPQRGRSF